MKLDLVAAESALVVELEHGGVRFARPPSAIISALPMSAPRAESHSVAAAAPSRSDGFPGAPDRSQRR
jgi:hypothetical protein